MINFEDVKLQAEWELYIESYEEAVAKEKERILKRRKSWFPWRIKFINVNEERNESNKNGTR